MISHGFGWSDPFGVISSHAARSNRMRHHIPFRPPFVLSLWEGCRQRAEDAQGKPTQSHISPSILVCEDKIYHLSHSTSQPITTRRGGLIFKAHRLFVSLNSRLESNKEEEDYHAFGMDSSTRDRAFLSGSSIQITRSSGWNLI